MGSALSQLTPEINWDEWSRVVEAAQDPRHRDSVQKFLAQAELSAEVPAALDEKLLAPRRSEGATGEQCAYVLSNLGFASLAAATREAAEFAMACGRLAEQLAPDAPDLVLRRHFLFSKGQLAIAALTNQPHLLWDKAAGRCTAFLRALDEHLEALPADAVEANAMAAYSFAAQCLARIQRNRAVEHYADEISQLVEEALGLAQRLPATFVTRMWSTLLPGKDAGVVFREIGAMAERSLQIDEDSANHAATGLTYVDEILSQQADQSAPGLEGFLQIKADLLLLSGRPTEACEQAEALHSSAEPSVRTNAVVTKARCKLVAGDPQAAAESLLRVAPTPDQALENWRAVWMQDSGDAYWTDQADAFSSARVEQDTWRLQAACAADRQDMQGFMEAADRCTGFFSDSIAREKRERHDPMVALNDVFERLRHGTALLQVVNSPEGILTAIVRKRDRDLSVEVAPERPNVRWLNEAHKSWSRSYFDALRYGTGSAEYEAEGAAMFAELTDEMSRNWGDLLQGLVEDNITQLILVGDDLVDIPLHATRIGGGDERLIDRVPVSYVPSLSALQACVGRTPTDESQRRGFALRSLIDSNLDAADTEVLAELLETRTCKLVSANADTFWTELAAARVLHIVARVDHDARMPFASLLGAGSLDLAIGELVSELDLTQCEVVSNLHGESALPSMLRAPGLDLAAVFLAAGAGSVLASTWVTNDELASDMTRAFFRHWLDGKAPSAAFRDALLQLRSRHPGLAEFHWAGMRLAGAP